MPEIERIPEIKIRFLTSENGEPKHLQTLNLFSVPRIGEYVVVEENNIAIAYIVHNIAHAFDTGEIEVYVSNGIPEGEMIEKMLKACENKLD